MDATNIYKVWILQLDRVIVSRDVQVDEKVMYDLQLDTTLPESGQTLAIMINEVDLDEEDIELLPAMEDTATSVPILIELEVESSLLGLLPTLQISPERATVEEIHVEAPMHRLLATLLQPPLSLASLYQLPRPQLNKSN